MEHRHKYGAAAVLVRFLRRRWKRPAQAAGLVVGVLGLTASAYLQPAAPKSRRAKPPIPLTEAGIVQSMRSKGVGSPLEAQLREMAVRPGQAVKKGQLLFRLDTTAYQTALRSARARADAARELLREAWVSRNRDLRTYEAEAAAARRELARVKAAAAPVVRQAEEWTLMGDGGTVRLVPVEERYFEPVDTTALEARLRQAQRQLEERRSAWGLTIRAANEAVAQEEREVKRLASLVAAGTRRSPMSGVVTAVYADAGQWIKPNVPVLRIDDPAGYRVVTRVDQELRKRLAPGTPLKLADGARRGKVERIESGEDRELFTYYVWIKPADARGLQPGARIPVKLPAGRMAAN